MYQEDVLYWMKIFAICGIITAVVLTSFLAGIVIAFQNQEPCETTSYILIEDIHAKMIRSNIISLKIEYYNVTYSNGTFSKTNDYECYEVNDVDDHRPDRLEIGFNSDDKHWFSVSFVFEDHEPYNITIEKARMTVSFSDSLKVQHYSSWFFVFHSSPDGEASEDYIAVLFRNYYYLEG